MFEQEAQTVIVGEHQEGYQQYVESCHTCQSAIFVWQPNTEEGRIAAQKIMEDEWGWLGKEDWIWLCPIHK